jgi:hypothetical protein
MKNKETDLEHISSSILKWPSEKATNTLDSLVIQDQVDLVLSQPSGRQRMDIVLLSSQPKTLVRAIPAEDLLLTIKDIGESDALSLIELSSDDQFSYLLDLEIWFHQGMELGQLAHWLEILFACGDKRIMRWLRSVDFELLVLMAERTILQIEKDDIENLPKSVANRVITPDSYHFFIVKIGADFDLVKRLLDLIYANDQPMFFALTGNLGTTPPAEGEELALRWRNGRLADRGWPDLEEALELYSPMTRDQLKKPTDLPTSFPFPPRFPVRHGNLGHLFSRGLEHIDDLEHKNSLASQLANLTNRVIVADGLLPTELDSIKRAAERVKGRLEIGLFLLGAHDDKTAANLLSTIPLLHVFRLAQDAILQRVKRAKSLINSPHAFLFEIYPSNLIDRLRYLSSARPMFLPKNEELPVEFSHPNELSDIDSILDLIESINEICQHLDIKSLPHSMPKGSYPASIEGLSIFTLLTTMFARQLVGFGKEVAPLPYDRLGDLLAKLPLENQLSNWCKSHVLENKAGLDQLIDKLSRPLSEQLTQLNPLTADPRFIEGLWLLK